MDPKLSQLDPKLREAYERVMNTPSSPPPPANHTQTTQGANPLPPHLQTPPSPSPSTGAQNIAPLNHPSPASPPPSQHLNLDEVSLPSHPVPPPPVNPVVPPPMTPPPAFNASMQPSPVQNPNPSSMTFNAKTGTNTFNASGTKKRSILPILIGIAIPIALVVYTAIWIKVLGVKLPFLS